MNLEPLNMGSAATMCVPLRLTARRASKIQRLELKLDVPFQPSTMFILKYYKVQITSAIIPRASSISPVRPSPYHAISRSSVFVSTRTT